MAFLSVNLAVLNLLPIPVLDGGHLVFLFLEGLRGRPLTVEVRQRLTQVGLVVILGIMVLALGNDLMRLVTGGGWCSHSAVDSEIEPRTLWRSSTRIMRRCPTRLP